MIRAKIARLPRCQFGHRLRSGLIGLFVRTGPLGRKNHGDGVFGMKQHQTLLAALWPRTNAIIFVSGAVTA